jgi:hypothetical protein
VAGVGRTPGLGAVLTSNEPLAYDCAPAITWVKDASQTIVVEGQGKRWWTLHGVDAVIWDLLTLNYDFARMVDFLAKLSEGSRERAAMTLLATVRYWEKEGIVAASGEGSDG